MPKYETLNVNPNTKKIIDRLSKKLEYSRVNLIHEMAVYFDKTGLNPKDQKVLSPAEELKKFRDTIISFMRKQEKDFILPVFGKMDTTIGRFMYYLENEAPKQGVKNPLEIGESHAENRGEEKSIQGKENLRILKLEGELSQQKKINEELKKGVKDIFQKSSYKSTGMSKKIVVEMSSPEWEEIKNLTSII